MSLLPPTAIEADEPTRTERLLSSWKAPQRPLLPDWLARRSLLLWVGTLPQVVLLWINLRAFQLIAGEMSSPQRWDALKIFTLELALLIGTTAVSVFPLRRPKSQTWATTLPLIGGGVAYLWTFLALVDQVVPSSIPQWMLPQGELTYYQFMLVMPLVFHTGLWAACRPKAAFGGTEPVIFFSIVLGAPLFATACILALDWGIEALMGVTVGLYFFFGALLLLAVYARACVRGYAATRRAKPANQTLVWALIGLLGPLTGLWLNAHLPFPSDFQTWPVYALTVVNGGLLLLPHFRPFAQHRAVWLAQCALFPFSLYFFLVFLPFLPLSLLAMLFVGMGFLILVPTALFLVHGQRLLEGFQHESIQSGRLRAGLMAGAAFAILPVLYAGQTLRDRLVLHSALDYIYSPDLRQGNHFTSSRSSVQRALRHLRDFKAGVQLPFLSDFYSWAVFDNLVLPDEKMNAMHQAFFGTDLGAASEAMVGRTGSRGTARPSTPILPRKSVKLDKLTATTVRDGACERTNFRLELLGTEGGDPTEYVGQIKIPDGVFISCFWLKIGENRVAGKLFEKQTALWVYEQISQVEHQRRDPGILFYQDAHTLGLRVYPFSGFERRFVEIEMLYPAGTHPVVQFDGESWQGDGGGAATSLAMTSEGAAELVLTSEAAAALPRAERAPYLHFIVDRSEASKLGEADLLPAMQRVAAQFPAAKEYRVTYANYELNDVVDEPLPIADLAAAHCKSTLPQRGGFLGERAIKHALLGYHDRFSHAEAGNPWLLRYPVVVLLGHGTGGPAISGELADFERLAPETSAYYQTPNGVILQAIDFAGQPQTREHPPVHPTALLRVGDSVAACPLDRGEAVALEFDLTKAERSASVWQGGAFRPLAVTSTLPPETPYSRGAGAVQRTLALIYQPALGNRDLTEIVQLSRETGILLPVTSYTVVENSAQWEILRRKEKQKLGNQKALEFEETPEPTTSLLVLAGAAAWLGSRRRRS